MTKTYDYFQLLNVRYWGKIKLCKKPKEWSKYRVKSFFYWTFIKDHLSYSIS